MQNYDETANAETAVTTQHDAGLRQHEVERHWETQPIRRFSALLRRQWRLEFSALFGHSEAKFVAGDARWKEPEARLDLVRLRGPSRRTNADDIVVGVGAADNCHNTSDRSRRRYSDHPATRGKGPHREKLKARARSFRRYVIAAAQKRPPSTRRRDTVDDGVTIGVRGNPLLIIALRRIPLGGLVE